MSDKVIENGKVLDVRCVWDAKVSGLNWTLWSPSFMLPNAGDAEDLVVKWLVNPAGHHLKAGSPDVDYTQEASLYVKTKQGDIDVGQHFSNFMANKVDQPYLGVQYVATNNAAVRWERAVSYVSNRLIFGCTNSPYIATQGQSRITEIAKRDTTDPSNPFHFEKWS